MTHVYTYDDALRWAELFSSASGMERATDIIYSAVQSAYRELADLGTWRYLVRPLRIVTRPLYATGSVSYSEATRQVSLSGGTWPSWAAEGTLRIGVTHYRVESRVSDTVLTLVESETPGEDVSSTNDWHLVQEQYDLPITFRALMMPVSRAWEMHMISRDDWLYLRTTMPSLGIPVRFAIVPSRHTPSRLSMAVYPAPRERRAIDLFYLSSPTPMTVTGRADADRSGTVSVSGTSVTGTGTSFSTAHVGAVLRIGSGSEVPTGLDGRRPYVAQAVIQSVESATALTVRESLGTASGVGYIISSPLDVEEPLLNLFRRCVEKHVATIIRMDRMQMSVAQEAFQQAFIVAREAQLADISTAYPGLDQVRPTRWGRAF
jgi:hypothetical protein